VSNFLSMGGDATPLRPDTAARLYFTLGGNEPLARLRLAGRSSTHDAAGDPAIRIRTIVTYEVIYRMQKQMHANICVASPGGYRRDYGPSRLANRNPGFRDLSA